MDSTYRVATVSPEQRRQEINHIADLECKVRELEAENARLREALVYITDPIAAAKRIVKESNGGLKLDAHMAIALSESANHLKDIARKALETDNG